jgi:hypothetical protein
VCRLGKARSKVFVYFPCLPARNRACFPSSLGSLSRRAILLSLTTLLEFQVLNTVSYPELLCHVREIPFRRRFHCAFLLILVKPNVLQPLIDIETEIPLFIKMPGPSGNKPPLGISKFTPEEDELLVDLKENHRQKGLLVRE